MGKFLFGLLIYDECQTAAWFLNLDVGPTVCYQFINCSFVEAFVNFPI